MIVRKEIADEDGYLFDPDFFLYGEDLDLALRIQGRGTKILLVPEAVVYHEQRSPGSALAGSLLKAHRAIRNRILAYFKNMRWYEFALFLPVLIVGSPIKAAGFGVSLPKKVLYGLTLIPLTVTALLGFALSCPKFAARRVRILGKSVGEPFWLWKRLGGRQQ